VGYYGTTGTRLLEPAVVETLHNGTWSLATAPDLPSNAVIATNSVLQADELGKVVCVDVQNCTAIGAYFLDAKGHDASFSVDLVNGVWQSPHQFLSLLAPKTYVSPMLTDVSCPEGHCEAVGTYNTKTSERSDRRAAPDHGLGPDDHVGEGRFRFVERGLQGAERPRWRSDHDLPILPRRW
jgi:hypothetical protein